jgi:hypothetical protein
MTWIKDVCKNVVCGYTLGVVKSIFSVLFFNESETEEIVSLKNLDLSVI